VAIDLGLFDNFERKIPIQTRGGPLRREDSAIKYAMAYVLLLLVGLVALLAILTTSGS
jgi:hypothetical protein